MALGLCRGSIYKALGHQIRRNSTFNAFRSLPVHEQFGRKPGEELTTIQFYEYIFDVYQKIMPTLTKEAFNTPLEGSMERKMEESYSRIVIPLAEKKHRYKYLSPNGSVRLGRLLEDLDYFSVYISYLHVQGRANWGALPKIPRVFVTGCVERLDLQRYDINPKKDIILEGHASYTGSQSIETNMRVLQEDSDGNVTPLLLARFVMINTNPFGKNVLKLPQLVCQNEDEKKLFSQGQTEADLRKKQKEKSYLITAPEHDEIKILHNRLMNKDHSYLTRSIQPDEAWMDKTLRQTTIICFPEHQNMYGKIFGGFLMRQAFEIAAINSKLFARTRTECITMDDLVFLEPVNIGDTLEVTTRITYTEDDVIQTRVVVQKAYLEDGNIKRKTTNTFHFTFVTRDNSKVRKVVPRSYVDGLLWLIGRKHLKACRKDTGI